MTEIRSYRRVFDLERRIYRIDRLRLNPAGVPVRGVVYFAAALAAGQALSSLPLLGAVAGVVPWYLRELLLPGIASAFLAAVSIEGRSFHLAAAAIVRHLAEPRRGGWLRTGATPTRWAPEPLLLLPDGSDARLRRLAYTGPGAFVIRRAHRVETVRRMLPLRRRRLRIVEDGSASARRGGVALTVPPGETVLLGPGGHDTRARA